MNGITTQGRLQSGLILILALLAGLLAGCTHNQTSLLPTGELDQQTSTANAAVMNAEGLQQASYHGLAPSQLKQDSDGNWVTLPGPAGVLSYIPATGQVYVISPRDAEMEDVQFTPNPEPGKPAFSAKKLTLNMTSPLAVHAEAYAHAVAALQGLTQTEATARVQQMQAAGEITATVAEMLIRMFVPTLPE